MMQLPFGLHIFSQWRYILIAIVVVLIGMYLLFGREGGLGTTLVIMPSDFKEEVNVSGTVIASKNVDLGFAANGRIAHVYAKVGQYVPVGMVLAQVENDDLIATVAQKQAALTSLLVGTRPEQIAISAATVESDQAKLIDAITTAYTVSDDAIRNKVDTFFTNPRTDPKLSFSVGNSVLKMTVEQDRLSIETTLSKWSSLVSKLTRANSADSAVQAQGYLGKVATLLVDVNTALNQGLPDTTTSSATLSSYATTLATVRTNINTTTAALTSALSALTDAEKTLALSQAGPTASDIDVAQADVRNAQAALAKTKVVAPFSGTVTRMDAKVGEIVSPTTSLISMQSNGIFEIETFVPEIAIARVSVGNKAITTLDAYGSAIAFPAVVVAVNPAETIKDGVPTYKTTLSFLAADPRIRSGMTTNVIIETGVLHDAIVIPSGSIGADTEGSFVSLVVNGKVIKQRVETGISPALGRAVVLSGLSAGDTILLSPAP